MMQKMYLFCFKWTFILQVWPQGTGKTLPSQPAPQVITEEQDSDAANQGENDKHLPDSAIKVLMGGFLLRLLIMKQYA